MWDPEGYGGMPVRINRFPVKSVIPPGTYVILAPNQHTNNSEIINLPGCSNPNEFKARIILAPWNYRKKWLCQCAPRCSTSRCRPPCDYYNAETTFRYFSNQGFKFILNCAANWKHNDPIGKEQIQAIRRDVSASLSFKKNCLGYWAFAHPDNKKPYDWDTTKTIFNQANSYKIYELLRKITLEMQ